MNLSVVSGIGLFDPAAPFEFVLLRRFALEFTRLIGLLPDKLFILSFLLKCILIGGLVGRTNLGVTAGRYVSFKVSNFFIASSLRYFKGWSIVGKTIKEAWLNHNDIIYSSISAVYKRLVDRRITDNDIDNKYPY